LPAGDIRIDEQGRSYSVPKCIEFLHFESGWNSCASGWSTSGCTHQDTDRAKKNNSLPRKSPGEAAFDGIQLIGTTLADQRNLGELYGRRWNALSGTTTT